MSANTLTGFKDVYTCHFCDLTEYGIAKPPTVITIEDKIAIVQSITLHHALLKSKAEIDQFIDGLSCLGTKSSITKYPQLVRKFFTILGIQVLTAGMKMFNRVNFYYC